MKITFYLSVVVLFVLFSCSQGTILKSEHSGTVEITDSLLLNTIKDFIRESKINMDSSYLTVSYRSLGRREVIYLSYESTFYDDLEPPIFISNVNGFMVFIDNPIASYINNDIKSQILDEIRKTKIKLEPDLSFLYHPPIWKITKCGESYEVEKTASGPEKDVIPCGFYYDRNDKKIRKKGE